MAINDFLLSSIDPTGKDDEHQLPRLQNEFHRRLGMTKSETIIAGDRNRKAAPASLRRIGMCGRSDENDCGDIGVVEMHVTSAELPG